MVFLDIPTLIVSSPPSLQRFSGSQTRIALHLSVHMKSETRLQLVTAFPISVGL